MGKTVENITDEVKEFIKRQKIFFVGTAPTSEGEVHIAPKGYDILRVLDEYNIIYLDYYGSENFTAQHLAENKKITLMWCSFDKDPCILRIYGHGKIVPKGTDEFDMLLKQYFEGYHQKMVRQLFKVKVHCVMTYCGSGVPLMRYESDRETLHERVKQKYLLDE